MSVSVVVPVRCPHCRSRLASKNLPDLSRRFWIRWCRKCGCTIAYNERHDHWWFLRALSEDES